ncbi:MAG: ABC transporter ATP-binding protein/permease [Oscillospiraceae bacterium]|nr:ABC transporter ATP-binding protein/permease [Oscillospiraceae bacterium]
MNYLHTYWQKYKTLFLLSVACVACEAGCDLLQPRLMSRLIDWGAAVGDLPTVLRFGALMLGVTALGALFAMSRNLTASYASQGFGADLRHDLFAKIQSLSVSDMDRFEGGSLVTRMTNDITQLQNFINGMMRVFFKAPVMCAGSIVMAATLNVRTAYIIVPVVILVGFVIAVSMRMTYPRFARVQRALDRLNTSMREYLAGIRLVKAFRRFKEEEHRFASANDSLTDVTVKAGRVLAVLSPCMALGVNLGLAAMLLLGARWVGSGDMRVGEIVAFVTYMTQLLSSLGHVSNVLNMFVRVKTSHERIGEVFGADETVGVAFLPPGRQECRPYSSCAENSVLLFDAVGFSYPGSTGQAALEGIGFSLEKGETLGVIGPTGSGKSTLAALLMRFYEVSQGKLYIHGTVSIVPQTAMLFTGTVKENLLWGNENATVGQIEQAAKAAQAHDFIAAMPEGYDTMIGQGGVNLSGGQKQRISIARALLREPEILILDDCTSALDSLTEAKVRKALRDISTDMACVTITQRVSAAMACDKILVLENGRQAGFGPHGALMESCPVYRDIYMSQIGKGAA